MKTLNIIGCGNVGKTLGYLWVKSGFIKVQDILNTTQESTEKAVAFLGSGRPVQAFNDLHPADLTMISTSDNDIVACCEKLEKSGSISAGNIVFHCSGALTSSALSTAKSAGCFISSIHPVKSFVDPLKSAKSFNGTYCGIEGDPQANRIISKVFKKIGGKIFDLDPKYKTIYHSASVMICNYLVSLLDVGLNTYTKSGIKRKTALKLMEPIVRGTLDNVFKLDTVKALTGPIARGDHSVVSKQLNDLKTWDSEIGEFYRLMGKITLKISRAQKSANPEDLEVLKELLSSKSDKNK